MRNGYYLTLEERRIIEKMFSNGANAGKIARCIGKCQATIYRELERGRVEDPDSGVNRQYCAEVAQAYVDRSFLNRGRRVSRAGENLTKRQPYEISRAQVHKDEV